jgi:hypothetical protein
MFSKSVQVVEDRYARRGPEGIVLAGVVIEGTKSSSPRMKSRQDPTPQRKAIVRLDKLLNHV